MSALKIVFAVRDGGEQANGRQNGVLFPLGSFENALCSFDARVECTAAIDISCGSASTTVRRDVFMPGPRKSGLLVTTQQKFTFCCAHICAQTGGGQAQKPAFAKFMDSENIPDECCEKKKRSSDVQNANNNV